MDHRHSCNYHSASPHGLACHHKLALGNAPSNRDISPGPHDPPILHDPFIPHIAPDAHRALDTNGPACEIRPLHHLPFPISAPFAPRAVPTFPAFLSKGRIDYS